MFLPYILFDLFGVKNVFSSVLHWRCTCFFAYRWIILQRPDNNSDPFDPKGMVYSYLLCLLEEVELNGGVTKFNIIYSGKVEIFFFSLLNYSVSSLELVEFSMSRWFLEVHISSLDFTVCACRWTSMTSLILLLRGSCPFATTRPWGVHQLQLTKLL